MKKLSTTISAVDKTAISACESGIRFRKTCSISRCASGTFRRAFSILAMLTVWFTSFCQTPFGISTVDPVPNSKISSIQELTLVFDLTKIKEEYPSVSTWYVGCNAMGGACTIDLKKGSEIVAQITDEFDLHEGGTYTIRFDNPILLEAGVEYTLVIPAHAFSLYTENYWGGYLVDCSDIDIIYIGESSNQKILVLDSIVPEKDSSVEQLGDICFKFNEDVDIKTDAQAILRSNASGEVMAVANLVLNEDGNTIGASFDNVLLYNTHYYTVEIPENTIFLKGETENGYQKISVNYSGASYRYFGYGRILPSNNSEVDYLARITVPVKLEAGAEYIGRDFKPTIRMYKVEGEERKLISDAVDCGMTEDTKGFYINIFDFALEPSSTYQIEVDKDSFHLWSMETQAPLRDTSNEALTLTYTTPAEITPLAVQEFGDVTPSATEPMEKLESFKVMLAPYTFESTFYYPIFLSPLSENYNVVSVVDVTDNKEVATFKVDIRWDNENYYWLENTEPLDVTLLRDHSYEVRVPAGMVGCRYEPIRELTANKEFAVTYSGAYSPYCQFTYSAEGLSDMTTSIAKGSTVTVEVTPAENFKVESVSFNGEDATLSGDSFTTPVLDTDEARLEVTFAYDGTVVFDFTNGVESVDGCPYKVWNDTDHIVIENVKAGADIKVYSVAGVEIAATTAGDDIVKISVLPGVYVIVIDNVALKIRH